MKGHLGLYLIFSAVLLVVLYHAFKTDDSEQPMTMQASSAVADSAWRGPSLYMDRELTGPERELVVYGADLIANTANYLGPNGSVAHLTNGMNCQNCHLDGGKKAWANNYGAVFSTYPKYRERSGQVESIYKRVSDCMERSLNGTAVDSNSREYAAIYAYIKWLGKDVKKGEKPLGAGIEKLAYLDRAADVEKGKTIYLNNCQSCHSANGEGQKEGNHYIYPPLWGNDSYNDGAGLYRISNFAGYVHSNMPFKVSSHGKPSLTAEDAWDVAAYVNSQPRPHKDQSNDWPDISKKPVDFAFGPYHDGFDATQHKYGPFKPIVAKRDALKKEASSVEKK
jgi:thiosulfate dehydrogenase